MKKYKSPTSFTWDAFQANSSSFKQVANSFSRGFSSGVKAGMGGIGKRSNQSLALDPIMLAKG